MPMGDWDRFKPFVSDYIEGNLDNSTRKEFEQELEKNSDLKRITSRVDRITKMLNGLPEYQCSDDFNVTLRERIHDESNYTARSKTVRRYTFAFSFVVLAIIVTFSISTFFYPDTDAQQLPGSANSEQIPNNPNYKENIQPASKVDTDQKELGLRADDTKTAVQDSLSRKKSQSTKNSNIKYVDDTKK
jgi:hypothetical protein